MLTVNQLFTKRLSAYWNYQLRTYRMVVDWIVALYIVIPALLVAGYHYLSWWHEAPGWMAYVPFTVVAVILFVFAATGHVRLFVEDGDQLFLLQRVKWFRSIMKKGILYTIIVHFVASSAVLLVLMPLLLVHYKVTPLWLSVLFLFVLCFRMSASLAANLISVHFSGWRYAIFIILFRLLTGIVFMITVLASMAWTLPMLAVIALLVLLTSGMIKYRLQVKGAFFHDVEQEHKQRMKYAAIVMKGIVEEKPRFQRKQPLLFRKSNLLFKKRTPANGLAEMGIKSFFRNGMYVTMYVQLVAIGDAIMIFGFVPLWIKGALWLVLAFTISSWLKSYWKEMMASTFIKLFPWKDSDKVAAAGKAIFGMVLPGFLIISVVFGFGVFSWLGAIVMIPIGGVIAYSAAHLLTQW